MQAFNMKRSYLSALWKGTKPYSTVPERIAEIANSLPDKEALVIRGDTERVAVTYKEILENAKTVAQKLLYFGIQKDDVIAIHDDKSPEWLYCTVGAQMCGAWPFHFYFERKDGEDVVEKLKLAKCKAIICQPGEEDINVKIMKHFLYFNKGGNIFSEDITSLKHVIFTTDPTSLGEALTLKTLNVPAIDIPLPEIEPEGIAAILISSGSTGIPKIIPKSHVDLIFQMVTSIEFSGMKKGDTLFNDRIFSWVGGYPVDLLNGVKRVTTKEVLKKSLNEICKDTLKIIQEERCDHAILFSSTIDEMSRNCSSTKLIHTVITGGGPISKRKAMLLEGYCEKFINMYGCTEMGFIALNNLTHPEDMVDYDVGVPVPGIEIKVVDKNGSVLEKGETGEIYVRTMYGSTGYIEKEQDWHKRNRVPGYWFKTGDAGFITEQGHLCVPGRIEESIIVEGAAIAPSYFEDIFKCHPYVKNAVAFAIPDKKLHEVPGIAVEVQPNVSLTEDILRIFYIEQRNAYYEGGFSECKFIPKDILIFDKFPTLANGKVARKDVKEKAMLMIR